MSARGLRFPFLLLLVATPCFVHADRTWAEDSAATDPPAPKTTDTGFKSASTDRGSVTLHLFSYVRYLNQDRLDATFMDSFGDTTIRVSQSPRAGDGSRASIADRERVGSTRRLVAHYS